MNSRRDRMMRLRSRSVTPSRGENCTSWNSTPRESAARCAIIMGLVEASCRPDPEVSPSPPRCHAFPVQATPGGTLNVDRGDKVDIEKTPGGHLRCKPAESICCHAFPVQATPGGTLNVDRGDKVDIEKTPGGHLRCKPAEPICSRVVEYVERMDLSEEETEEHQWHVQRWLETLEFPAAVDPGTSSDVVVDTDVDVRPSTSAMTNTSRCVPRNDGSDLDSDFDDEFDEVMPSERRDIPSTEELEEPVQRLVNEVSTAMDDVADSLLDTSVCFNWSSDFESFRAVRENFCGPKSGPLKEYETPYDSFTDIWDKDIIELIVQETNRYAQQTIDAKRVAGTLKKNSRLHSWTDTNADEILLLFGMFMYMAIVPRTSLVEYWTQDEVLQQPGFRSLMPYNRYVLLNKFLHFVDNNTVARPQLSQTGDACSASSTRLRKLVPIIDHLGKKFRDLYNLGPDICIDESLTLFKGRLSWVQTIRSKAARFGIKSYELCESSTGYMVKFQIYTGKDDRPVPGPSAGVNLGGKSTKIVLELLNGLEHRGHRVVMDNFYNCPALARYLKSLGFDCLGTLRACRRNVPSEIAKVPKKVSKGTIIARHCGDVSIIAWMDSKMVNIISTYHGPDTYTGTKAGKLLVKPLCVKDYNRCMGGVDLKDQKLSMYLIERKRGVKWYIKMFKRLLNVSIHNALIMFLGSLQRNNKLPMTHREFRYDLAASLVNRHRLCFSEISRPVGTLMRLRRDVVNCPEYLKGQKLRKRCVVCQRQNITKLVHSRCIQCDVFICLEEQCWKIWHSASELPGKDISGRKRRHPDE